MKVDEEREEVSLKLSIQKMKIMASGPISSWHIYEETMEAVTYFIFLGPKSLQMVTTAVKLKDVSSWRKKHDQPRQQVKKQRHYFANKGLSS